MSHDVSMLIKQMTWETVDGKLSWEFSSPPQILSSGTSDLINVYVACRYAGRQTIGLYEKKYKYFLDEENYCWSSAIVFVMFDDFGRIIFESKEPDVQVNNLFEVAKDKASGIDLIVRSLLKK